MKIACVGLVGLAIGVEMEVEVGVGLGFGLGAAAAVAAGLLIEGFRYPPYLYLVP